MKNKKFLTRLFALLASLVLVLALALPCFAEDVSPQVQYQDFVIDSFDDVSAFLALNLSGIYFASLYNGNVIDYVFYGTVEVGNSIDFLGSISVVDDSSFYIDSFQVVISDDYFDGLIRVTEYSNGQFSFSNSLEDSSSFDNIRLVIFDVPISSTTDPTTPSSDMYSNLFNILKDAVYGSDAELTGSQEYALTLISTILTYATILLPVILVIFIAVWCFKRF